MSISDEEVKQAAIEYLSSKGDQPFRVTHGGWELWESHTTAMRAALSAAAKVRAIREGDGEVCQTCFGTGMEGLHSLCRDCDDTPTDNLEAGAGDLVERLLAAYQVVAEWPEKRSEGFSDLLRLRNLVPEAAAQLAAVTAENARLREALTVADLAICDWLNLYASDMCEPGRVAEAQERVGEQGTIAYISGVLQSIRAALSQEAPK